MFRGYKEFKEVPWMECDYLNEELKTEKATRLYTSRAASYTNKFPWDELAYAQRNVEYHVKNLIIRRTDKTTTETIWPQSPSL